MTKKLTPFLIVASMFIAACARPTLPDTPRDGIRPLEFGGELLLPGGETLEDRYFREFFKNADYVLLGESHASMTDHLSQAAILEKMARQYLKPALGMEFVNVDDQPALDRFNRGEISPDQLAGTLGWARGVGYAFWLYRPIFEVAAQHKIPVYALNIPRRVVRDARLNGLENVAPNDRKYLPARFIPAPEKQIRRLRELFGSHPAPQNESSKNIEGFITAQAVWDSVMAERAARVRQISKRPVVIVAGQGHVEYGWGIASRLRIYDPAGKIVSVMPWRAPLEGAFMSKQESPLLDAKLPAVFPTADLADIYYYSPLVPAGKAPQGLIAGQDPASGAPRLMVLSVVPGSAAEKAGFLPGDVIVSVNRREMANGEDFYAILAQAAVYASDSAVVVERGKEKISLVLPAW